VETVGAAVVHEDVDAARGSQNPVAASSSQHSSFFVVCLSVVDCGSPSSHVSPSSSPSDVPTVGPTGRFVSNSTRTSSTEQ
jgi:hypothetical protein